MATRRGWTQDDYARAGKTTLLLRLDSEAAKNLAEVSHISGVTRQKIIESLLADPVLLAAAVSKLELERPAYESADFVDPPKAKAKKKARKAK